jgi:hypothetical protein
MLEVTVEHDGGGPLSGVEVTLSGPTTEALSCQPFDARTTTCTSHNGFDTAGSYVLHVTAPGFQSADVNAEVTVDHHCCTQATLHPSIVTLNPS